MVGQERSFLHGHSEVAKGEVHDSGENTVSRLLGDCWLHEY